MGRERGRQGLDLLVPHPDPPRYGAGQGAQQIAPLGALVFDFDGLIADTETPEFESWCAEFHEHGATLRLEDWINCVGAGPTHWDVFDHLETLIGPFDRDAVAQRRRARYLEITRDLRPLPGVVALLDEAAAESLPCAIASSSTADWVGGYLARFGLADRFAHVVTRDMVALPKPAPDLFQEACNRLGVSPGLSVALEDSVNGLRAAKAAGLVCVVVPNAVTSRFDLSAADHTAGSVAELDLGALRALVATARPQAQT